MNKNENKKDKKKKVFLGMLLGTAIASAIIIPPLLYKNCSSNKEIKKQYSTIIELKTNTNLLKIDINNLESELAKKSAEINTLKDELAKAKESLKDAKIKLNDLVGSDNENYSVGANGENAKSGSLIYRLKETIRELETQNSSNEEELANTKNQLSEALNEIAKLKEDIKAKNNQITSLTNDLNSANLTIEDLRAKLKEKEKENDLLREEVKRQIAITQRQKEELEFKIAEINGDNEAKARIIEEQKQMLNDLNTQIDRLNKLIEVQKQRISENETQIANLIVDKEMNKNALLDSIVSYRNNIKDLLIKVEENKAALIESVNEEIGNKVNEAKNLANEEDKAKYDEILKALFSKEDLANLINNGETKLTLIRKYNSNLSEEELQNVAISNSYKSSLNLEEDNKEVFDTLFALSNEELREALISNGVVDTNKYEKLLKLLNVLKENTTTNLDVLKEAKLKQTENLAMSYSKLERLLETLNNKYSLLVGDTSLETEIREDGKNANGGIVKKLSEQIQSLKNSLNNAESKLLALYGSVDADYELGEDGENAKDGSYIKVIYDKLKYKEEQYAEKRLELNEKDRELLEKEEQIQTLNTDITSKAAEIENLQTQKSEKEAEIERLKEENRQLKESNSSREREKEELTEQNNQKQRRIEELERENRTQKESIKSLTTSRDAALRDVDYWKGEYIKAKNGNTTNGEELRKAKAKLEQLTGSNDASFNVGANGENAKPGSLIYNLNQKIKAVETQRDDYKSKWEIVKSKNEELQATLAGMVQYYRITINEIPEVPEWRDGFLYTKRSHILYYRGKVWSGEITERFKKYAKAYSKEPTAIDSNGYAFDKYYENVDDWNKEEAINGYKQRKEGVPTYFDFYLQKDEIIKKGQEIKVYAYGFSVSPETKFKIDGFGKEHNQISQTAAEHKKTFNRLKKSRWRTHINYYRVRQYIGNTTRYQKTTWADFPFIYANFKQSYIKIYWEISKEAEYINNNFVIYDVVRIKEIHNEAYQDITLASQMGVNVQRDTPDTWIFPEWMKNSVLFEDRFKFNQVNEGDVYLMDDIKTDFFERRKDVYFYKD